MLKLGMRTTHLPIFNIIHGDWHLISYSFLIPSSQQRAFVRVLSSKHCEKSAGEYLTFLQLIKNWNDESLSSCYVADKSR